METRTFTEIKAYTLILNPMRSNTEAGELVAVAYEKEKLIEWYNSQLAPEPYTDEGAPSFLVHGDSHTWHKVFQPNGPLEWYNPVANFDEPDPWGHGIGFVWTTAEGIENNTTGRGVPLIE